VVNIRKLNIPTDWADAWHMFLGFLTRLLAPWSIIIFVVYVVYQVGEREPQLRTIRDLVIYALGYIAACILLEQGILPWR
jgi:hypothetical protein